MTSPQEQTGSTLQPLPRIDGYEPPQVAVLGRLGELTGSLQPNYGELGPRPHKVR